MAQSPDLKILNTLGVSMARLYYGPAGINPPHIHPRASEVLTVTEGSLLVSSLQTPRIGSLLKYWPKKVDVFVFPAGLVHFERSVGGYSAAWASFNSQNPCAITISKAVFGSKPSISDDNLAKAFQENKTIVDMLQMKS